MTRADFTLVAFGGAGPLHACEAAERLDIPRVLVPEAPGVLCALGLLIADVAVDYSRSVMRAATAENLLALRDLERELLAMAAAELRQENIAEADMRFAATLDMRYEGQAYELNIPFGERAADAFHEAHERTYGHAIRWRPVEIVNIRVNGSGANEKPSFESAETSAYEASPVGEKTSPIGGRIKMFQRADLGPGARFSGEALVFQMDSTTFVPPGWSAQVDGTMNLLLTRD